MGSTSSSLPPRSVPDPTRISAASGLVRSMSHIGSNAGRGLQRGRGLEMPVRGYVGKPLLRGHPGVGHPGVRGHPGVIGHPGVRGVPVRGPLRGMIRGRGFVGRALPGRGSATGGGRGTTWNIFLFRLFTENYQLQVFFFKKK